LLIVGDSSVGKANFIYRFIENKYNQNYMTTSGIKLKTIKIEINNNKIRVHSRPRKI
jgi:GTPase SAR1 family protein